MLSALVIAALIGSEFPVDQPASAGAAGFQAQVRVAASQTGYLAVWRDGRADPLADYYNGAGPIVATRVDLDGQPLDPDGLWLTDDGVFPTVASDGTDYLVIWNSDAWPDATGTESGLLAVRIAADGTVLDATPIPVAPRDYDPFTYRYRVALSFDGTDYIAVWTSEDSIVSVRIAPDGTVGPPTILFAAEVQPQIACRPTGDCAVVWAVDDIPQGEGLWVRTLSADGVLSGPARLVSERAFACAVAWSGDGYLAVWREDNARLFARRFDAAWQPTSEVLPMSTDSGSLGFGVAGSDAGFLVAWVPYGGDDPGSSIEGRRISGAGVVLDDEPVLLGRGGAIAVASVGEDYMLVRGHQDVTARRWPAGAAPDETGWSRIALGTNEERLVAADRIGDVILVAWVDDRHLDETWLYAARVTETGEMLDPAGIPITPLAQYSRWTEPDSFGIVSDGADFIVTWHDYPTLFARRVGPDGTLAEPLGIAETVGWGTRGRLAYGGDQFLLVWSTSGADGSSVRLQPLSRDLAPLGSVMQPLGETWSVLTSVATTREGHVISWSEGYGMGCHAMAVGFDGVAVGSPHQQRWCGVVVADPSGASYANVGARVVFPELIEGRSDGTWWEGAYDIYPRSAVFDGERYVVSMGSEASDILAGFFAVEPSGDDCALLHNLTPVAVPVAAGPLAEIDPLAVPGSVLGTSFVFYTKHDAELGALRVVGRKLTPSDVDFTGAETAACESRDAGCGCDSSDGAGSGGWLIVLLVLVMRQSHRRSMP